MLHRMAALFMVFVLLLSSKVLVEDIGVINMLDFVVSSDEFYPAVKEKFVNVAEALKQEHKDWTNPDAFARTMEDLSAKAEQGHEISARLVAGFYLFGKRTEQDAENGHKSFTCWPKTTTCILKS